ncbi:hypothetical protein L208DRAFT_1173570, partial [Tricholoma matsutake]
TDKYWRAMNPPPNIHVTMDENLVKDFVKGYQLDKGLKSIWNHESSDKDCWIPGRRLFKEESGLLYFQDEEFQPRLCMPEN